MTSISNIWKQLTSILWNLNNHLKLWIASISSGWKFRLNNLAVKGLITIEWRPVSMVKNDTNWYNGRNVKYYKKYVQWVKIKRQNAVNVSDKFEHFLWVPFLFNIHSKYFKYIPQSKGIEGITAGDLKLF